MPRDNQRFKDDEKQLALQEALRQSKPQKDLIPIREQLQKLNVKDEAVELPRKSPPPPDRLDETRNFIPSRAAPPPPPSSKRDILKQKPPSPLRERKHLLIPKSQSHAAPPSPTTSTSTSVPPSDNERAQPCHFTGLPQKHIPGVTVVERVPDLCSDTSSDDGRVPIKGLPEKIRIGKDLYELPKTEKEKREEAERARRKWERRLRKEEEEREERRLRERKEWQRDESLAQQEFDKRYGSGEDIGRARVINGSNLEGQQQGDWL